MAGNKAGGLLAAEENKRKYGEDFYKRIGAIGGSKKVKKGFATLSYERVAELGSKGGTISRRRKANG